MGSSGTPGIPGERGPKGDAGPQGVEGLPVRLINFSLGNFCNSASKNISKHHREPEVNLDHLDQKVRKEIREKMEVLELRVIKVSWVYKDYLVHK